MPPCLLLVLIHMKEPISPLPPLSKIAWSAIALLWYHSQAFCTHAIHFFCPTGTQVWGRGCERGEAYFLWPGTPTSFPLWALAQLDPRRQFPRQRRCPWCLLQVCTMQCWQHFPSDIIDKHGGLCMCGVCVCVCMCVCVYVCVCGVCVCVRGGVKVSIGRGQYLSVRAYNIIIAVQVASIASATAPSFVWRGWRGSSLWEVWRKIDVCLEHLPNLKSKAKKLVCVISLPRPLYKCSWQHSRPLL